MVAPVAERAAMAAILADSEDPWAHYALGSVYLFARRFDDSLAEFELALRLNPNFSLAQGYYGLTLSYCGCWEEGNLAARRALLEIFSAKIWLTSGISESAEPPMDGLVKFLRHTASTPKGTQMVAAVRR